MAGLWSKIWKVLLGLWIVFAVFVLLTFRNFSTPAGSMIPTLRVGDYMVASTIAYGYSKYSSALRPPFIRGRWFARAPQRGDLALFALPRDTSVDYIKRVVGLPGDKVQMKEGRLYINGTMVPREPVAKVRTTDYYGRTSEVPTYRETLPNGVSYTIIEIQGDTGFNDNTEEFTVPPDNYFMLGDNRDNSTDSRIPPDQGGVGFVPSKYLVGRPLAVFFATDPDSPFPRILR